MDNLFRAYEMFFDQFRQGELFVVNHLESERGREMNGRRCQIVGVDKLTNAQSKFQRRIQVRLLNQDSMQPEGKPIRMRPQNLVDPRHYTTVASRPTILPKDVLRRLKLAMKHAHQQGHDCPNMLRQADFRGPFFRCKFLKEHLDKSRVPPKSKCMDLMVPDMNEAEKFQVVIQPGCVGDGYVDFSKFGEGLVGKDEDCPICQEPLSSKTFRLPCDHTFHIDCAQQWLQKHETCPTCRSVLPNPWSSYVFTDVDRHIQRRMEEWFLTGFCERCQAVNMENNPVVEVACEDGTRLLMQESEARRRGATSFESIQGLKKECVQFLGP